MIFFFLHIFSEKFLSLSYSIHQSDNLLSSYGGPDAAVNHRTIVTSISMTLSQNNSVTLKTLETMLGFNAAS